ncbi:MAG: hypothetical protein QMC28_03335 [Flavobacteriales bacterium]
MLSGKIDFTKIVALTGSEVKAPSYYKVVSGANMSDLIEGKIATDNVRYISGNILTGQNVGKEGYLSFYENQVKVNPEGYNYKVSFTEGWLDTGFNKL